MFSLRAQQLILTAVLVTSSVVGSFLLVHWYLNHDDTQQIEAQLHRIQSIALLWRQQQSDLLAQRARALADSCWLKAQITEHQRNSAILIPEQVPGLQEGEGFFWLSAEDHLLSAGATLYPLLRDHPFLDKVLKEGSGMTILSTPNTLWWIVGQMMVNESSLSSAVFLGVPFSPRFFQPLAEATQSIVALPVAQSLMLTDAMDIADFSPDNLLEWMKHAANTPILHWQQNGTHFHAVALTSHLQEAPNLALFYEGKAHYSMAEWMIRFVILLLLLLGLGIGSMYWLSARWLRFIAILRNAVEQAAHDDFDLHIRLTGEDEFYHLGDALNQLLQSFAEKEKMRKAMEKVVSKQIAYELLQGALNLRGEERFATLLYADIQNFSPISADLSAVDLLQFLNNYFTRMSFCIDAHNGVIDKYQGDAFTALFGVPSQLDNEALSAIMAALDILEALELFNLEVAQPCGKRISLGIGIHSGEVIAGNLGAEDRLNYSVLGESVDIAMRIQGLSKGYGVPIVASGEALARYQLQTPAHQTTNLFIARQLDVVQLKPHLPGIKIWEIMPRQQANEIVERIQHFELARGQVMANDFNTALASFRALNAAWPEDIPTQLWLKRCTRYAANKQAFCHDYPNGAFVFNAMSAHST